MRSIRPAIRRGRYRFRRRARPPARSPNARPARAQASAKTEDLGTQVIQGVSAQGKRVTRVIPAGKEGNEKEIDIVTETWYSPDLQVVVMSKTSDPRFGESVYQLNAITRTEPDPALFAVPSDYAVKEGRADDAAGSGARSIGASYTTVSCAPLFFRQPCSSRAFSLRPRLLRSTPRWTRSPRCMSFAKWRFRRTTRA